MGRVPAGRTGLRRRTTADVAGVAPRREAPPGPAVADLLRLQRSAGNHAVAGLLQRVRAPADAAAAERERETARAALASDQQRLRAAMEAGSKSDDLVLRNSIEWIDTARGGVLLYAVRQTGDSAQRAKPGEAAFFPKASEGVLPGHLRDANLPDYAAQDLDDDGNVHHDEAGADGWNDAGRQIAIRVGDASPAELGIRIKHEVQHTADRHEDRYAALALQADVLGEEADEADRLVKVGTEIMASVPVPKLELDDLAQAGAQPAKDEQPGEWDRGTTMYSEGLNRQDDIRRRRDALLAEHAFEKFKTEFRAYWYMADPKYEQLAGSLNFAERALDMGAEIEGGGGLQWSPRQAKIVLQIVNGYPKVAKHFDANSLLQDGRRFVDAVNAYRLPDQEGLNKLNSVRVDHFRAALQAVPAGTDDPAHPSVATLLQAAAKLTAEEGEYLRDTSQSAGMDRLLAERLTGKAADTVRQKLPKSRSMFDRWFG